MLGLVSSHLDSLGGLLSVLEHLPPVLALGWVVRMPGLSPTEGHEAITRVAFEGLDLTDAQGAALIRGVRAPDVSIRGLAVFAFPFRQPRHALRAWYSTTTADGVAAIRAFVMAHHARALADASDRRWERFGEVLHCLQDSYSPAHVERDGARILRMKHWGLLDRRRGGPNGPDEHGFPTDERDVALRDGALVPAAQDAARASHAYLELALQHVSEMPADKTQRRELDAFLDEWVTGPADD
jgi:hypothetical protein